MDTTRLPNGKSVTKLDRVKLRLGPLLHKQLRQAHQTPRRAATSLAYQATHRPVPNSGPLHSSPTTCTKVTSHPHCHGTHPPPLPIMLSCMWTIVSSHVFEVSSNRYSARLQLPVATSLFTSPQHGRQGALNSVSPMGWIECCCNSAILTHLSSCLMLALLPRGMPCQLSSFPPCRLPF